MMKQEIGTLGINLQLTLPAMPTIPKHVQPEMQFCKTIFALVVIIARATARQEQ
jgi:hypothetical protein